MKKLFSLLLAFLLVQQAWAHVGSSIVLIDGNAGPYRLRVVVRPPTVIPGRAEIDVRFLDSAPDDATVTVLPVTAELGLKGAPRPDVTENVPGDATLRHGELWLMTSGSYSVHVHANGTRGSGTLIVPLDAIATQTLPMSFGLSATLGFLGFILFAGGIAIASSGAKQSILPPDIQTAASDRRRALVAGIITAAVFILLLVLLKRWWGYEAWRYRNEQVYRSRPLQAQTLTDGQQNRIALHLAACPAEQSDGPLVLLPDHGKLMHLFIIRDPQLDAFGHLHPIQLRPGEFQVVLPPFPDGKYILYADVTYENGFAETLTARITLPAARPVSATEQPALFADPDDSWYIPGSSPAARFTLQRAREAEIHAGEPVDLAFRAIGADGAPVDLDLYMGMLGHAAVRRDDGSVFAHLHPTGTISMASLQYFEAQLEGKQASDVAMANMHSMHHMHHGGDTPTSELSFPYVFPRAGNYRMWVQCKAHGEVATQVFELSVLNPR